MELRESIIRRRTTNKAFKDQPLREEDIREIIFAANRAPSHFNSQPWDFILVTDPKVRQEIGDIAGESMQHLISKGVFFKRYLKYFRFSKNEMEEKRSGIFIDKIPMVLRPFISKIFGEDGVKLLNFLRVPNILGKDAKKIVTNSPLLLGFMLKKEEYQPGEKSGIYSLISMGAALQNMWLTATSLGIGLQFVSTPMEIPENWDKILKILKVPETHELMAVYRLGYIYEDGKRNTIDWVSDERRSFEDLVSWNYYGGKKV
ncbi:MAG TPA: nitroreductase family protein [Leptospiraceae bacterium]|nr:nitroreductase family protein [Leptospiraceae bacterium]HMW05431.1 nitroreductase family protein [Leptospiraceae bacterium]HMX31420.1 nitroreductase family protein [Leptospiraceae bacterium]HMY30941.1 nitroreductase family protein [Leptospiraceae bacterium]HMZ63352.1 nitroreductase family protein [Leptospiraceae bacterium]